MPRDNGTRSNFPTQRTSLLVISLSAMKTKTRWGSSRCLELVVCSKPLLFAYSNCFRSFSHCLPHHYTIIPKGKQPPPRSISSSAVSLNVLLLGSSTTTAHGPSLKMGVAMNGWCFQCWGWETSRGAMEFVSTAS